MLAQAAAVVVHLPDPTSGVEATALAVRTALEDLPVRVGR